jgi:hypothetical protein
MNALGKIFAIILVTVMLFVVPISNSLQKQDDIIYNFVYETTNEFVDMIRANGYITPGQYAAFEEKIQLTGNLYIIEIEHQKIFYIPDSTSPGNIIAAYEGFYNYEILEQTLFNTLIPVANRNYEFNKGDYITITVVNTSQTAYEQFKNSIGRNPLNNTIYVIIGGMIGNENY